VLRIGVIPRFKRETWLVLYFQETPSV